MRFLRRVNERGTLTLPAEVREALGVEQGDIMEFEVINVVRKGETHRPNHITESIRDASPLRRSIE